jgi:hypothetical protein
LDESGVALPLPTKFDEFTNRARLLVARFKFRVWLELGDREYITRTAD